jgi:hypothetical protein
MKPIHVALAKLPGTILWRASCEINGQPYEATAPADATEALANHLADQGLPDAPIHVYRDGELVMTRSSFYWLAERTLPDEAEALSASPAPMTVNKPSLAANREHPHGALSPEAIQALKRAFDDGATIRDAARIAGVSVGATHKVRKRIAA